MGHHEDYEAEHTPEAIRQRLAHPGTQGYLKDSIYGAIDGAVTTFAIVSSVAGAGLSSGIVVILGLANVIADGFSMASGNFLGTRAENQAARKARREEQEEIERHPEGEREEIRQIYARKGFEGETLEEVVRVITSNHSTWLDTMLHEEHGLTRDRPSALKAAMATFVAFLLIGGIPLGPYLLDIYDPTVLSHPFLPACILTGIVFFAIGALKSRFTDQHWILGGLEALAVGALAAGMAYAIGFGLSPLIPEGLK